MGGGAVADGTFFRSIFDAIPVAVFLADEDAKILDMNQAAVDLVGKRSTLLQKQLCGDVLRCVNARKDGGCGKTDECPNCVARQGIQEACQGRSLHRVQAQMKRRHGRNVQDYHFLVSSVPFEHGEQRGILLMLEDVTELMTLRRLLPICVHCKRVRDDEQFWQDVTTYLHERSGIRFSQGLCPDCAKELHPEAWGDLAEK